MQTKDQNSPGKIIFFFKSEIKNQVQLKKQ